MEWTIKTKFGWPYLHDHKTKVVCEAQAFQGIGPIVNQENFDDINYLSAQKSIFIV